MRQKKQKMNALNPNPLAPAQSKHCLSFSRKTRNSIENTSISHTFSVIFVSFSSIFQKSLKRGPGSRPRVLKRHQNGSQGHPNRAQRSQNGGPRSPSNKKKQRMCTKGVKMEPNVYQGCQNGAPGVTMGS